MLTYVLFQFKLLPRKPKTDIESVNALLLDNCSRGYFGLNLFNPHFVIKSKSLLARKTSAKGLEICNSCSVWYNLNMECLMLEYFKDRIKVTFPHTQRLPVRPLGPEKLWQSGQYSTELHAKWQMMSVICFIKTDCLSNEEGIHQNHERLTVCPMPTHESFPISLLDFHSVSALIVWAVCARK